MLEIGSEFKGGLIFLGSFTVNHGEPWNFFLAITASCYRAKWIPRRVFRFLERVQRGKLGYLRRDTSSPPFPFTRYVSPLFLLRAFFHIVIKLPGIRFFNFSLVLQRNFYIPLELSIRIKERGKERVNRIELRNCVSAPQFLEILRIIKIHREEWISFYLEITFSLQIFSLFSIYPISHNL